MRIGAWLVLLVVALVCSSPPAYAQREPSESDKVTARTLMDRGDKYVEEGKLDAALKAYKAADDIMKVPTTGLELGRTQIKVGQLVEATNTLQRVMQHPVRADESNAFRQAREEARQLSATLPSRIPSVTLVIEGIAESDTALVKLDGQPVRPATLGLPRQINPGDHTVTVNARGYKPVERRFKVAEGQDETVTLALVADASSEGPTPAPAPDAPSDEQGPTVSALTWVGLSVGLAFIIVGTATGVVALGQGSDLQDVCSPGDPNICDEGYADDIDNATILAHVSTASFVVGGVAMALGIVSLAIDLTRDGPESSSLAPRPGAPSSLRAQLYLGPGAVGVRGRF
jgi:hypothetical protein